MSAAHTLDPAMPLEGYQIPRVDEVMRFLGEHPGCGSLLEVAPGYVEQAFG